MVTCLTPLEISSPTYLLYLADTIADLRALVPTFPTDMGLSAAARCFVGGYYAVGDIDSRTFIWTPGSALPDNGGNVIGSDVSGQWIEPAGAETNVKHFGAKGDGATVDTVAIQNALNQGGVVSFPAGTFISAPLTTTKSVVIRGAGKSNTILQLNASTVYNLLTLNAGTASVADMSFVTTVALLSLNGLVSVGSACSPSRIVNCSFNANSVADACCVQVQAASDCVVELCTIQGGNYGIYANAYTTGMSGLRFVNNVITGVNNGRGIGVYSGNATSQDITASNNVVHGGTCLIGIEIWSGNTVQTLFDAAANDNKIDNCGWAISFDHLVRGQMNHNSVVNCPSYGLEVAGCNGVVLAGNEIDGTVAGVNTTGIGISIPSGVSQNVTISGGFIKGCTNADIYAQGSTSGLGNRGINISSVLFLGGNVGVQLNDASNCSISNCTFVSDATTYSFISIGAPDLNVGSIQIQGNVFSGACPSSCGLLLYATAPNTIGTVNISGNDTSALTGNTSGYFINNQALGLAPLIRCGRNYCKTNPGPYNTLNLPSLPLANANGNPVNFQNCPNLEGCIVECDVSAGAGAFTLYDATMLPGYRIGFLKTDSSGNAMVVTAKAGQTINGASTNSNSTQYKIVWFTSDGSNWILS